MSTKKEINTTKLILGLLLVLIAICVLVTVVFFVPFIWINNEIGGLGNPYLFWP